MSPPLWLVQGKIGRPSECRETGFPQRKYIQLLSKEVPKNPVLRNASPFLPAFPGHTVKKRKTQFVYVWA